MLHWFGSITSPARILKVRTTLEIYAAQGKPMDAAVGERSPEGEGVLLDEGAWIGEVSLPGEVRSLP